MEYFSRAVDFIYNIFWGDIITIPLPGDHELGISLLVLLLIPTGIYFTIRTKILPVRMLPEMVRISCEKEDKKNGVTGWQSLIVSTATRVGMGNLAGVVAAISMGGAGAVFWMWVTALIGSATAYIEGTLAQKYNEPDPIYGGKRGGPAYYIHAFVEKFKKRKIKKSIIAILFAVSGLICWGGISQVVGNSVTEAFTNAFDIDPIYTIVILVAISAVIVLRKNATVKVLDIIVPIMAGCYFLITIFLLVKNFSLLPGVFGQIFKGAFGLQQVVAGGFGAILMNGVKRGLFSNEAGSGSAPCAAASAVSSSPVKIGLMQALGVLIDTVVICSCTAFIMLMVPAEKTAGLEGMSLLQAAMDFHLGEFGVVFIAITLWLFAFSTFVGVLYYARSNVSYLFGDRAWAQTAYKIFALVMLFVGGLATYKLVWTIGDIGIALMTVFNIIVILPMGGEALKLLKEYERDKKLKKRSRNGDA